MRMGLKWLVMLGYCHGVIEADVVAVVFRLFRLQGV